MFLRTLLKSLWLPYLLTMLRVIIGISLRGFLLDPRWETEKIQQIEIFQYYMHPVILYRSFATTRSHFKVCDFFFRKKF
jgi:hypothetical protein